MTDNMEIVNMKASTSKLTPGEIWESKDVWMKQEKESKEIWDSLSDKERASLLRSVTSGLEAMQRNIEGWLPMALEMKIEHQTYIDVKLRLIYFNNVEEAT